MKETFVVFSGDFGRRAHCATHLFKEIAKNHRVIWVETSGLRNPRFNRRDFSRIFEKLLRLSQKTSMDFDSGIEIRRVLTLPWTHLWLIQKLNRSLVKRRLGDLDRATFVSTFPTHGCYAKLTAFSKRIYYCVDDFGKWEGYSSKRLSVEERELVESVDLILTTSPELTKARPGATYFAHGTDVDHFRLPPLKYRSKELCVFGLLDERLNEDFLVELMSSLPEYNLKLVGEITTSFDRLKKMPNVSFTGQVPYEELPDVIATTEAFILPYKANDLTKTIEPLKLREYLATGRQVLTTDFGDLGQLEESLFKSNSVSEWVSFLRNPNFKGNPVVLETWAQRASAFINLAVIAVRSGNHP